MEEAGKDEADLYIAYNMYWEKQQFGIPTARNKKTWKVAFSTSPEQETGEIDKTVKVPGRCVTVLISEEI